ncbi:hypothetical protein Clacol_002994 [Clathrus columnatus]|uniref:Acetyl-CoA synthetase-like protein n=1 Tax=Clathrus columnatus TaxID=1419009 RepID=A0AAV5A3E3_9AGAM|nr:hypothetical protein Clacol_002994 [Clathrus columnatus]
MEKVKYLKQSLPAVLPLISLPTVMSSAFIHLQTLCERIISHPNTPVFKIPKQGTSWEDPKWIDISYTQFNADIERVARYWYVTFGSHNIPLRSVIGVWLPGFSYVDAVTIYAISRAGYVPQMFGFELPNTQVVLTLLASSSGRAIIHHPAKATLLAQSGTLLPCLPSVDYNNIPDDSQLSDIQLPPLLSADDEDYAFIYHSSGSVSGMPKVVPVTNKWLSTIQYKSTPAFSIGYEDYKAKNMGQDIYGWTLRVFLTFYANLSRNLPELVELMHNMRQVTYAGMPLETELQVWANEIGIPLTTNSVVTDVYAGQLMTSTLESPYFELLPNVHAEFIPICTTPSDPTQADPGYGSLLELHILSTSPDLPIPAFRSSTGGWLSGDLFQAVSPGKYIFRGDRLDTKAIENEVYSVCGLDLVANCVVVGYERPWPMLFVELKPGVLSFESESNTELGTTVALQKVKGEIIRRLENFNSLIYPHERVEDPRMVYIVLPPRKLPRTAIKGNIRRRGVEQEFAQDIETAYTSMPMNVFGGYVPVENASSYILSPYVFPVPVSPNGRGL